MGRVRVSPHSRAQRMAAAAGAVPIMRRARMATSGATTADGKVRPAQSSGCIGAQLTCQRAACTAAPPRLRRPSSSCWGEFAPAPPRCSPPGGHSSGVGRWRRGLFRVGWRVVLCAWPFAVSTAPGARRARVAAGVKPAVRSRSATAWIPHARMCSNTSLRHQCTGRLPQRWARCGGRSPGGGGPHLKDVYVCGYVYNKHDESLKVKMRTVVTALDLVSWQCHSSEVSPGRITSAPCRCPPHEMCCPPILQAHRSGWHRI